MADNVTLSVRVGASIRDRLDKLAGQTDRSRAWHITKALEQYLNETEQDVDQPATARVGPLVDASRGYGQSRTCSSFDLSIHHRRAGASAPGEDAGAPCALDANTGG